MPKLHNYFYINLDLGFVIIMKIHSLSSDPYKVKQFLYECPLSLIFSLTGGI